MAIEQRLEEAARDLARVADHASVPPIPTRQPRPNRSALAAAAAVVLIATTFVVARSLLHEDGHTSVKTLGPGTADTTTGVGRETSPPVPLPAGATALSRGPLVGRFGHSTVWTGKELIVWGGWADEHGDRRFDDGAAYNPSTDTWRTIASAPLSPRHEHAAADQAAAYEAAGVTWLVQSAGPEDSLAWVRRTVEAGPAST